MVRESIYPCRVASRKENLCVGTHSTVTLEHINGAAEHIQEHKLSQIYSGVEKKGQTHDEKKRNIFSISLPKLSIAQGRLFPFLEGL